MRHCVKKTLNPEVIPLFLMRFTERAYTNYTGEDVLRSPNQAVRVTFSNSHFDPSVASRQYNESLDEWQFVEELGFEGMMLNEHHNTPTSSARP